VQWCPQENMHGKSPTDVLYHASEVGLPLNRSELAELVHVDRAPGMGQVQLAEQLGLDPSAQIGVASLYVQAKLPGRPRTGSKPPV
jgi:hypothetical protein